ncbi:MAG: DUF1501 domain-containing protein [Planctomycetota bacterium]|nr:MAG: DUF1501 domain-containing protein [Planctomycetota bacterium]REJ95396.1 MAG: DUF1501 domain-containing protein [Planctomycetota bacterium]REK17596.1 MAG: DUF1501 domain-containing protein [Planctomycetota bacterium]REK39813.1 MAG: DUF1501 domain-containing protein [Planctomycetota bacterium]
MLARCGLGFGSTALASLLAEESARAAPSRHEPLAARPPHFPARARNVIFLFMEGGVSQVDSFDPKPLLQKLDGQPFPSDIEPTQFNEVGNTFASPWRFRPYGECGIPVSELFPHVGQVVDELAVVRSAVSEFAEHTNANYHFHTGSGRQGLPSAGAWVTYGLGSENQNLPGYVVIESNSFLPPGGPDNFGAGFLPASYQGSMFRAAATPVPNIAPAEVRPELQRNKLNLVRDIDELGLAEYGRDDQLESAIANFELAYRMQTAVPDLADLRGETAMTKRLYGLDAAHEPTRLFATECLLARRMVERGVRFVELLMPAGTRWDQHSNFRKDHRANALTVDQPIAALISDLKQRGLLDETLVLWSGEFGRTPFAQGKDGRDHNEYGFSLWMAGGGIRGGVVYGATDEFGYKVIDNPVTVYDLHATMLHLLGLDHRKLTYRFGGRDMRLTDVHGHVLEPILA